MSSQEKRSGGLFGKHSFLDYQCCGSCSYGWLHLSYLVDWIAVIGVGVLAVVLRSILHPRCRFWSANDGTIQYPYSEAESFPNLLMGVLCAVIPLVVGLTFASTYGAYKLSKNSSYRSAFSSTIHQVHALMLALCGSVATTFLITELIKLYVGRYRPDFFSRVAVSNNMTISEVQGLTPEFVCNMTSEVVLDGRKSFPSGHSSLGFAAFTVLSLYLLGFTRAYQRKNKYQSPCLKGFISYLPMVFALVIAASRVEDYRHHPADIIAGVLLGITIGIFSYFLYFPSLTAKDSHKPYDRTYASKMRGMKHVRSATKMDDLRASDLLVPDA